MAKKIVFGSGTLWGVQTGTGVTNPTPAKFAALQGCAIDIGFSTKELYGQHNFPITVARGAGKITVKASSASFQARAFNDLFFNGTLQSGNKQETVLDESGVVPSTPFQITVSGGATFVQDLGVIDKATGSLMQRVASAPATGQYSVNTTTGVYTFNTADVAKQVLISYIKNVVAGGSSIIIAQQLLGAAPRFKAVLSCKYEGQQLDLQLNACVATKLSFATKQEDFAVPDFEFSAFADDAGEVGRWVFPDAD